MMIFLKLAFLFSVGSLLGWCIEVVFRRFAHKKWINPGFLVGPCLPLYGFSLVSLYLLAHIDVSFIENPITEKIVLFIIMAICITVVEYIAGLVFIKGMKIKLWDYSDRWGNIQGIICPLFTFFWMLLSAVYYFLVHPYILDELDWFVHHIEFSFVIGMYYGILVVDVIHSFKVADRIRKFATEKQIVVRLENFKASVEKEKKEHFKFLFPIHTEISTMRSDLEAYYESEKIKLEQKKAKFEEKAAMKAQAKLDKIKSKKSRKNEGEEK